MATTGIFYHGVFYLRNAHESELNAERSRDELIVEFGLPGDLPVMGDWDGDGVTTIGLYGPRGEFLLRNRNTAGPPEIILTLGISGSFPLAGAWDGGR